MPSTYAHYRLGKLLLPQLPSGIQQSIGRFRRMYDMGLQGPDFFYYHNPFLDTAAGRLGNRFHQESGKVFFSRACKAATTEAGLVYLYGLLAHYALDSVSHPFVDKKVAEGAAEHVPMEKEFDRYLMDLDGLASPHTQLLGDKIRLTRGECVTVAAFFPPATPNEVNASVKFMHRSLNFLARSKRGILGSVLKRTYPSLMKHGIPEAADGELQRLNSELLARFNWVLRDYPKLLEQLREHIKTGEDLGEDFDPIFG